MRGSRVLWRRLVVLLVACLLLGASPWVRPWIKGAALVLEVLPSPIRPLSALTSQPSRAEITILETQADLYEPRGFLRAPGIVLVHGANPQGKDDPRVRALATSLSRTGRRVLVPQLGLRHERLDEHDTVRIRRAVEHLNGGEGVGILAFSYGAALALLAVTADPALQEGLSFVATVGTFFDLTHLIQGVTTGTVPYGETQVAWETVPEARDLVAEQLGAFLGADEAPAFRRAWAERDPAGLAPEARSVYELMANRDPGEVPRLLAALPEGLQRTFADLSPSSVVDRIDVPILALHSRHDPAAPSTESRLLVEAVRDRVRAHYFEVGILEHVDPVGSPLGSLGDGWRICKFTSRFLRAQEGWPRP